jgi:hypothetical protein
MAGFAFNAEQFWRDGSGSGIALGRMGRQVSEIAIEKPDQKPDFKAVFIPLCLR